MVYVSRLEAFAGSVQSQTYELHELCQVSSIFYVTLFLYYENTSGAADFMPTSLLEESFIDLLHEYPLLSGALHENKRGRYTIVVDRDNLNLPEFKETQCEASFDELRAANYAPLVLPEGAATVGRYLDNSERSTKLTRVHIVRCKDNGGVVVFAGIAHVLVDGSSFNLVMRRWAELCRHRASKGSPELKPGRTINFSPDLLDGYVQQAAPPAGAFVRHAFRPGGIITRLFCWFSIPTQVRIIRMMSGGTEFSSHFYSLSRDTIDEIRRAIKEVLPAGQGVSANDAISALVNVAVAQCLECPAPGDPPSGLLQRAKAAIFGAHKPQLKVFEHMGAADVRPRLKMDPENAYCGSAIVLYTSNIPLDELQGPVTPRMLALVATATRKGTDSIDKGYIYAHAATIAKEPDCTMRPFAYGTGPPAHLVMTNHSRIGHYHVDFGWGTPVWANVIEETMSSLCYVLPPPPGRDGNVIHMMIPKDVQTRMQQLPFWKDKTKLIR